MPCTIGLNMKKFRPGNYENSAGFTRGLNSGGLLKKQSPILILENLSGSHATIPLKSVPDVRGIYQAICVKKK